MAATARASSVVQAPTRNCDPMAIRERSTMRGAGGGDAHATASSKASMLRR